MSEQEQGVVLSVPALVTLVAEIETLNKAIAEGVGTMGAIMADAKAKVLAAKVDVKVLPTMSAISGDTTWEEFTAALETYRIKVSEAIDAAVVKQAGTRQTTHKAKVDAMTAERDAKLALARSFHSVMTQPAMVKSFPGIEKVTLPTAGGTKKATSGETKATSGPAVSIYKVENGGKVFLTKGSPLSLAANRWFDKCPVADLRDAIVAAGVDPSTTFAPISVTANGKTATIGGDAAAA